MLIMPTASMPDMDAQMSGVHVYLVCEVSARDTKKLGGCTAVLPTPSSCQEAVGQRGIINPA